MKRRLAAITVALGALALTGCDTPWFITDDLVEPIVPGGQPELDAGNVVYIDFIDEGGCTPTESAETGCTVWIGGHRSTHGSVFATIVDLEVGDRVHIVDGRIHTYEVTAMIPTPRRSPPSVIHGDLVIQTSLPEDHVMLVYADAVHSD